ncbi:MAG: hypothetical protein XD93_0394 [candidate division WS6 bacterium 34_10]|jgi:hydrogenase maturation factor|uniref:Uncharacterized protein n=1 Tax=candidate division WS6 bacterium 34_10 TaxID=1641389 RepID=A0A124FX95_9BACT|nr:MAG: hypothetical protein XD93_0394 [candidate division WS6 bacterium 34_10]
MRNNIGIEESDPVLNIEKRLYKERILSAVRERMGRASHMYPIYDENRLGSISKTLGNLERIEWIGINNEVMGDTEEYFQSIYDKLTSWDIKGFGLLLSHNESKPGYYPVLVSSPREGSDYDTFEVLYQSLQKDNISKRICKIRESPNTGTVNVYGPTRSIPLELYATRVMMDILLINTGYLIDDLHTENMLWSPALEVTSDRGFIKTTAE